MINKVLFISLSNIGDAILTLPALDQLIAAYPGSSITVLSGPRPKEIFENHPAVARVIIYNKRSSVKDQIRLCRQLRREKFDLVIDLRNTFLGALISARRKIPFFLRVPAGLRHMRDVHLYKTTAAIGSRHASAGTAHYAVPANSSSAALRIRPQDHDYISAKLKSAGITDEDRIIVIAPGARSQIKRWPKERFMQLLPLLAKDTGCRIVLAGDDQDAAIANAIADGAKFPLLDLAGQTTILQLAALLKRSALVITNDSAILHLSGYLDVPTLAIFGPTDEHRYGPWSGVRAVVKKEIFCRPCCRAQCRLRTLECMNSIKVDDVLRAAKKILTLRQQRFANSAPPAAYRRILISRIDRIGDVLLSTPVIKALRLSYPNAYIAMMVSPYAAAIVDGNPYLDSVIVYDKDSKHKAWLASAKFARNLAKQKFELALILHPTNRAHLVSFFAGIRRRVGYDRKFAFLLTDTIKHTKHLGEKHESEYNLDLVRHLGIDCAVPELHMPIKKESQDWADELFKDNGIGPRDKLLAIHPAASCPSKIWPPDRFAETADRLSNKYGFKIIIVAGPKDIEKAKVMLKHLRVPALNLAGRTSVAQLAAVLKRCALFISNDSGPVHIATAVGTPVISIFGRAQKGLGPRRWGPLGPKDKYLHKDAGCLVCLAHECLRGFVCLKSISVDDVCAAAQEVLK